MYLHFNAVGVIMEVEGIIAVFSLGCLGGILVEFARWFKLREAKVFPEYSQSWFYWFMTIGMILIGGCIAMMNGIDKQNAFRSLYAGAGAPALLGLLLLKSQSAPDPNLIPGSRQGMDAVKSNKIVEGWNRIRKFLAFGR